VPDAFTRAASGATDNACLPVLICNRLRSVFPLPRDRLLQLMAAERSAQDFALQKGLDLTDPMLPCLIGLGPADPSARGKLGYGASRQLEKLALRCKSSLFVAKARSSLPKARSSLPKARSSFRYYVKYVFITLRRVVAKACSSFQKLALRCKSSLFVRAARREGTLLQRHMRPEFQQYESAGRSCGSYLAPKGNATAALCAVR
jgi:hypothetical protein